MSVLDALDATRICTRLSPPADESAWVLAAPSLPPRPPAGAADGEFSWRSLVRNPSAMLVTGMVGTMAAMDAVLHALTPIVPGGR